jgi:ATP-binding cassette subfamily B protein
MRRLLHVVWQRSVARVAQLKIAPPRQIPLATPGTSVFAYLWAATRVAAPKSTAGMVFATFAATFCNVALAYALGQLTASAAAEHRERVITMMAVLLGLWLATPLWHVLHSLARLFASQNLRIAVTDHLTARLMYARTRDLAKTSIGNLVERVELAAGHLPGVVCSVSDTAVKLVSVAVLGSVLLIDVSVPLAILAGAWMVSAVLLSAYLAYSGMGIVEDASDAHAQVIAELTEIVSNVPLIRGFAAQKSERLRFGKALDADLLACRHARSYWILVLLIETAYKWLFGIATLSYSLLLYESGAIGLPELVTVGALVISLSWHFESVAFNFVDLFDSLGILRASLRELDFISVDLPQDQVLPTLPSPGRVRLRAVSASYDQTPVLHDVSLDIEPGQKVGIVGPSGSGKSTLLALLRGDVRPDAGSIEIHGVPLTDLPAELLADASSEANQAAQVFNRSVVENLCYGTAAVDLEAVGRALQAAQARALVEGLPHGLETRIGERGANLSTGERQRLAIARALLKRAPLLLLDEAMSSVDSISEARILEHIVRHLDGCTIIAVSHRVSTLAGFDVIVVLEQGRVVDRGTHEQLLARSELYQRLQLTFDVVQASPPRQAVRSPRIS